MIDDHWMVSLDSNIAKSLETWHHLLINEYRGWLFCQIHQLLLVLFTGSKQSVIIYCTIYQLLTIGTIYYSSATILTIATIVTSQWLLLLLLLLLVQNSTIVTIGSLLIDGKSMVQKYYCYYCTIVTNRWYYLLFISYSGKSMVQNNLYLPCSSHGFGRCWVPWRWSMMESWTGHFASEIGRMSPMTDPWCCYIWCSMDLINKNPLYVSIYTSTMDDIIIIIHLNPLNIYDSVIFSDSLQNSKG